MTRQNQIDEFEILFNMWIIAKMQGNIKDQLKYRGMIDDNIREPRRPDLQIEKSKR